MYGTIYTAATQQGSVSGVNDGVGGDGGDGGVEEGEAGIHECKYTRNPRVMRNRKVGPMQQTFVEDVFDCGDNCSMM